MTLIRLLSAIAVVTIVLVSVACSDDEGEDATPGVSPTVAGTIIAATSPTEVPSPKATLETAPTATIAADLSPEEEAGSLKLLEVPEGMLQWVTDGPYVVPGDALGVFYLNIETKEIEGWFDLLGNTQPIAFSGEGRYSVFSRKNQVFAGGKNYPAGVYLADRQSHLPYRWTGDAELVYQKTSFNGSEIAARGDLVLFRVPVTDDDDWFVLLNARTNMVESTFQAEGQWALISRDAKKVAVVGNNVSVVDVAAGEVTRVALRAFEDLTGPDEVGLETGKWSNVEMIESADDGSFLVAVNGSRPEDNGAWLRYDWNGDLFAKGTGATVYLSPDGEYVAVAERIPDDSSAIWHSLNALNTEDASPAFRIVGVDEQYTWPEHNRWLADDSGIVVQLPDGSLKLARRDGSIEDYIGVPSPTSPGVFAAGGGSAGSVGAFDASGTPIIEITFQGGVRDFVDPWGENGEELRMLIPHGGHGGPPATASIIEPYVEEAPYDGGPELQLSDLAVAFGLMDLYDEPGGEVVGRIRAPYRVTVHEVKRLCSGEGYSDPTDCPATESPAPHQFMALVRGAQVSAEANIASYWARVTTDNGQEGWLLMQANGIGI